MGSAIRFPLTQGKVFKLLFPLIKPRHEKDFQFDIAWCQRDENFRQWRQFTFSSLIVNYTRSIFWQLRWQERRLQKSYGNGRARPRGAARHPGRGHTRRTRRQRLVESSRTSTERVGFQARTEQRNTKNERERVRERGEKRVWEGEMPQRMKVATPRAVAHPGPQQESKIIPFCK